MTTLRRLITALITLTATLIPASPLAAQEIVEATSPQPVNVVTASDAFERLPVDVLDLLSVSSRKDLVDYAVNDSTTFVVNDLGGKSSLNAYSNDFIDVQITPASSLQIKILPSKKGNIVMTIYTVGGDGHAFDSDIAFFDAAMRPIPADKIIRLPELKDFFSVSKGDGITYKEIRNLIPFPTLKASAATPGNDLTVSLTIGEAINRDELPKLEKCMRPPLRYRWTGSAFKRIKE